MDNEELKVEIVKSLGRKKSGLSSLKLYEEVYGTPFVSDLEGVSNYQRLKRCISRLRKESEFQIMPQKDIHGRYFYKIAEDSSDSELYENILEGSIRGMKRALKRTRSMLK